MPDIFDQVAGGGTAVAEQPKGDIFDQVAGQQQPQQSLPFSLPPLIPQGGVPIANPFSRMAPQPTGNLFMDSVVPNPMLYKQPQSGVEGLYNTVVKGLTGATSPFAATLGAVVPEAVVGKTLATYTQPLAKGLIAGLGAKQAGQTLGEMAGRQNATPGQTVESLGDLAQSGLMTLAATPELTPPIQQPIQPRPVISPDEIMAALQKRQIVRQEPAPEVSTQPTVPEVGVEATQPQPIVEPPVPEVKPTASQVAPVVRQAVPLTNPTELRPAIIKMGGEVIPGKVGEVHNDIIAQHNLTAQDIDSRVFVDNQGNVLSREQAALATPEIPTSMEEGRRHANELPQPSTIGEPNDTQSQRGIQGSVPQGEVPQPNLQEPSVSQQEAPTGGVLQAPKEVTPLRQEVESQSDFLHDLNGLAGLIKGNKDAKRITSNQAVSFKSRANQVNEDFQAGKITQADAQRRIGVIREDIGNQVSLGEELGPQEVPNKGDFERYTELTSKMREALGRKDFQSFYEMQKETEAIKNRNKGMPPTKPEPPSPQESPRSSVHKVDTTSLSPYAQSSLSELGITDKTTAHEAVENIANNPSKFGSRNSELARFLTDNFEHVLRSTSIDLGTGRSKSGLPNYDPIDNTVYLGANLADIEHPLSHAMLEEAAHAATYWQIEHPVTDLQTRASKRIKSIMEQSKSLLPESDIEKIGEQPYGLPYRHSSLSEFVAGMFSDPSLRRHLESFNVEGGTAWTKLVDWVKDVLGIKKGTALDSAMDELVKVGQEKADINPNRRMFDLDPVNAPAASATGAVIDRTLDEKLQGNYNKWRGYTVPKHVAASEEAANRLVRYASARVAAPEVAKWMATDVLGPKWKDSGFATKLGSVLVEDRLRSIKSGFEKLAQNESDLAKKAEFQAKADSVVTSLGMQGSALRNEAEYRAALEDPEIKASIEAHRQFLGPMTENMHKYLGGELAEKGEDTDAFVNLIAMLNNGDEVNPGMVPSVKEMIYGSTKGNLANPRVRGSTFSKQAKGTGIGYEFDYRKIAERMVRGNYEQYALKRYYEKLVEQGLAVEAKPGTEPPKTLKGQPLEKIEIKPGRAFIAGRNLWVRRDLAGEMRRAMDVDKVDNVGLKLFTDLTTDLQVIGPTDAAWHTVNMLAVIAGSQGGKSMWYDAVRKLTPVGVVDGLVRMAVNTTKAIMDTPEVQRIVAEYSAEGAGRAKPIHQGGLASKFVTAVTDIPLEKTQKYDPFYYVNKATSSLIKAIDKGGRVTASKMFDNLVERGMVENTELNRREFINRMGQYNSRLMPQWQQIFRDNGLSAFVVAGKNMNRQAIRRILMSPGFRAANPEAFIKSRLIESASLASMVLALPVLMNLAMTGKPFGRPGIPIGGIDLGTDDKDGKPRYFDPLQLLLIRRGLRITGIQSAIQARDEDLGTSQTAHQVVNDIFQGYIHPWAGPAIRTGYTALTGRDTSGYLQSRNPGSMVENLVAAAKNVNPTVASLFRDSESGKASPKSVVSSLAGAVGIKSGRNPSQLERLDQQAQQMGKPNYSSLSLFEKRQAERTVEKSRSPRGLLSERAGAFQQLEKNFERQDLLVSSLPKEQVNWAKQHKLDLHKGFATELTLGRVRLPETSQDKEFMLKAVAAEYSKVIAPLMKRKVPPTQQQLDRFLDVARARARVRLRAHMSGRTSTVASPNP